MYIKEQRINKLQEDQLDSVIKTNQSVRKTNTIITITSITTLIFVIVAAITSIFAISEKR
jgi:Mg2+ and Co2+ transporter CorA